jgi:hypothetical protein
MNEELAQEIHRLQQLLKSDESRVKQVNSIVEGINEETQTNQERVRRNQ